jgi:phosphoglycerate dehydrogenase-like enzyme
VVITTTEHRLDHRRLLSSERMASDLCYRATASGQPIARDLPNTILTPHMLGHTVEGHAVLPCVAVEAITHILAGEPPRYVRNPKVIPKWRQRWAS